MATLPTLGLLPGAAILPDQDVSTALLPGAGVLPALMLLPDEGIESGLLPDAIVLASPFLLPSWDGDLGESPLVPSEYIVDLDDDTDTGATVFTVPAATATVHTAAPFGATVVTLTFTATVHTEAPSGATVHTDQWNTATVHTIINT